MVSIARYIEQLKELQFKTALESLQPTDTQRTEWNYGYVCGIKAGLDLALKVLDTDSQDDQEDPSGKNPSSRKR